MIKKVLFALAALVLAGSLAFAGLAFAQGDGAPASQSNAIKGPISQAQATQPPVPGSGWGMMSGGMMGSGGMGRGMMRGGGVLYEYMQDAWADALDLTREELDSRLAAGEMHYAIALDLGVTAEEFPALMTEVRAAAVAAAVADGALTQAQADRMLAHTPGQGMGGGACPMHPAITQPSQAAPQS